MPKPRGGTSYRLSEGAQALLSQLSDHLGVTKTGILEMAIRKLAHLELPHGGQSRHPRARRASSKRMRRSELNGRGNDVSSG